MKRIISLLTALSVMMPFSACAQDVQISSSQSGVQIIQHKAYTTCFSSEFGIPLCVSWTLSPEHASSTEVSRTDDFRADPLVKGYCPETTEYSRNGMNLDRGHMAPAADFKWDAEAMSESFYMTNICPQNHDLNETEWLYLEQQCRFWARYYKSTVHIACGPLVDKHCETLPSGRVRVPVGFWKVVCYYDTRSSRHYAVGFLFDNSSDPNPRIVTVDDVEVLTGIDFFGFVKDGEEQMESIIDRSHWKNLDVFFSGKY